MVHITIVEGDDASVVSTNRGSISSQTHSEWLRVELKKGNDVFMVRYHYVLSGYPAEAKLLQLIASDDFSYEDRSHRRTIRSQSQGLALINLKQPDSVRVPWHSYFAQGFESAAAFASAYSIGKTEAAAAVNLLNHISAPVREKLQQLARTCRVTYSG